MCMGGARRDVVSEAGIGRTQTLFGFFELQYGGLHRQQLNI